MNRLFQLIERVRMRLRMAYWRSRLAGCEDRVIIYPMVEIIHPENVYIGSNVAIASFVHVWAGGGVHIGRDTLIAAHVAITSQTHDPGAGLNGSLFRKSDISKPVRIGANVWIGSGAVILPGVTVGDGAIVGAGSVVNRDVAPGAVVVGIPARAMR